MKDRLIDILKNRNREICDTSLSEAIGKMENQKRLSSKEFQKTYETIWEEGPTVRYQNIGSKEMLSQANKKNPTLW